MRVGSSRRPGCRMEDISFPAAVSPLTSPSTFTPAMPFNRKSTVSDSDSLENAIADPKCRWR